MIWGQGTAARSPRKCVRPERTTGGWGEPQGSRRQVGDRRRVKAGPQAGGAAAGGVAPAPKPAGAGNLVKSNEVQTVGPAGAGAASSGAG